MAGRLDRPFFELLTQTWYKVFMWNKYSRGGAKKARPPIDHKTQIRSLEVASVVFTATSRLIEINAWWILWQKENTNGRWHKPEITILPKLVRQRHIYSSEKATSTFVPNQIGDRSVGKRVTRRHQSPLRKASAMFWMYRENLLYM